MRNYMKRRILLAAASFGLSVVMAAQSAASAKTAKGSVERQLRASEDRAAILQTLYAYTYSVDFGKDMHEYTDLYTDDALFQSVAAPGRPWSMSATVEEGSRTGPGAVVGREALEKWITNEWAMRDRLIAAGHYRIHETIAPDVTIDGDRAFAHSYFETTDNDNGRIYIVSIGVYKDELVRSTDGRWRIKERLLLRQGGNAPPAGAKKASDK
jgi:ketosteroid isomerase-like protein